MGETVYVTPLHRASSMLTPQSTDCEVRRGVPWFGKGERRERWSRGGGVADMVMDQRMVSSQYSNRLGSHTHRIQCDNHCKQRRLYEKPEHTGVDIQ